MKNELDFFQRASFFCIAIIGGITLAIDYSLFKTETISKLTSYINKNLIETVIFGCTSIGASFLMFFNSKTAWLLTTLSFSIIVIRQYYFFYVMLTTSNFNATENQVVLFFSLGLMVVILLIISLLLNFLLSKEIRNHYL